MTLDWIKCVGSVWCKLNAVNLDHAHFDSLEGVYMIWHGGHNPHVVYVGQGVVRDRLRVHRSDQRIQRYIDLDLFVTWASVQKGHRDGIEVYLADVWKPKVGDLYPVARPIAVNPPW